MTRGEGVKNIMGVNGAKTTPSALSSSMLPYLLGELLSKANRHCHNPFGALTQHKQSIVTTREEREKGDLTWAIE